MTNYFAIIPAAGKSERFKSATPKQYHVIDGTPILQLSIQPFLDHPLIAKVVVVLSSEDKHWNQLTIAKHPKILSTIGGETRSDSVINALQTLATQTKPMDWILVHDGARPFININEIDYLIEALHQHAVGGLFGVPVKDTLKKVSSEGEVLTTIDRTGLWHALTPQMFRYQLLKDALENARRDAILLTDDSSAIEIAGYRPVMLRGSHRNTKITFNDDIEG